MIPAMCVATALVLASPSSYLRKHRASAPVRTRLRGAQLQRARVLALRHALLHGFLVEVGTEAPAFADRRVISLPIGVSIGPATADIDFLGSPIIRARVRNTSGHRLDILLTARLRDARGKSASMSIFVDGLPPGAARIIELLSPAPLHPAAIEWSITDM
jgi:hypothetical protein